MKERFYRPPFVTRSASVAAGLLLLAWRLSATAQIGACDEKIAVLKVGSEVYSNVTVTMATATDIFFTYSGGMGNAKLEKLAPEVQSKFHFNATKALEKEKEERQANARFDSWIRQQTNSGLAHAELPPAISIEVAGPTIEYKYYNLPLGKPEDMHGETIGTTRSPFNCDVDLDVRAVRETNGGPFAFHFDAVKLSIAMPVTITLPLGALRKLKDHEEGHRHIDEYFYSFSRKAADRAVQVTLTNNFPMSDAKDQGSAEEEFGSRAKSMILTEYFKYTLLPSRQANVYYDQLTDHGRNDVGSAEAAETAIQRYAVQIPDGEAGIASVDESSKR